MKIFRVRRDYGEHRITEMCFAEDEDDVYDVLDWVKTDRPELQIEEIEMKRGCFLSIMHNYGKGW